MGASTLFPAACAIARVPQKSEKESESGKCEVPKYARPLDGHGIGLCGVSVTGKRSRFRDEQVIDVEVSPSIDPLLKRTCTKKIRFMNHVLLHPRIQELDGKRYVF